MKTNTQGETSSYSDGKNKVIFPASIDVLIKGLETVYNYSEKEKPAFNDFVASLIKAIKKIKDITVSYSDDSISQLVAAGASKPGANEDKIQELILEFKNRWKSDNQFFTIFDTGAGKEVYIDPRMTEILGLDINDFKTATAEVLNPETSIYHRDDLYHGMRFALIGYTLITLPLFDWHSNRDHYIARFRINTKKSRFEKLRKLEYLHLEKKCFMFFENNANGQLTPKYHFDLYSVQTERENDYVYRSFVSEEIQAQHLNMLAYLVNMYLLDISPKYLLLLGEKQHTDRYKAVSSNVEKKIKKYGGLSVKLPERHVADYFSKSIRSKVAQVFNEWDQRPAARRIQITSDAEAVEKAKHLGLLPIPASVKEIIYKAVR